MSLINREKSVIVAADVEPDRLANLVKGTCGVEGIGGYKIGLVLALTEGLPSVVNAVREQSEFPIIYDHQKAGNDIPEMGTPFARTCRKAGVNAVILFPFGGGKTAPDWIKACQDQDLGVLVGAHMTQPQFLWEEGGVIHTGGPQRIFEIAAQSGVTDFVVPGNKVEYVQRYRALLETIVGEEKLQLYAPGFIKQGGQISEMAAVAGKRWHAIVGSAIYNSDDVTAAAEEMTRQIK